MLGANLVVLLLAVTSIFSHTKPGPGQSKSTKMPPVVDEGESQPKPVKKKAEMGVAQE